MEKKKKYQKPVVNSEKIFEKRVLSCVKAEGQPACEIGGPQGIMS